MKDKVAEDTQSEQQKEQRKSEDSTRGLWANIKHHNIFIEGDQREKRESKKLRSYLKK